MSDEFPLYSTLKEEGKKEAEAIFEQFKVKMKQIQEETLGELYTDVAAYIESDAWTNFRNDVMAGYRNYGNRKIQSEYDFKQIREQIFYQFRDEITKDLDQDNLEEIQRLKKEISRLHEMLDRR